MLGVWEWRQWRVRLRKGILHGEGRGKANNAACHSRPDDLTQGNSPGEDRLDWQNSQQDGEVRTDRDCHES